MCRTWICEEKLVSVQLLTLYGESTVVLLVVLVVVSAQVSNVNDLSQ